MKKLALAIGILATSFSSSAKLDVETCIEYADLAKTIMEVRQQGVDMAKLMQNTLKPEYEGIRPVLNLMIQQAYKMPKFSGQDYIDETVGEFSNKWMGDCIEMIE